MAEMKMVKMVILAAEYRGKPLFITGCHARYLQYDRSCTYCCHCLYHGIKFIWASLTTIANKVWYIKATSIIATMAITINADYRDANQQWWRPAVTTEDIVLFASVWRAPQSIRPTVLQVNIYRPFVACHGNWTHEHSHQSVNTNDQPERLRIRYLFLILLIILQMKSQEDCTNTKRRPLETQNDSTV